MTPVTVDELVAQMVSDARQQAANILSMAYDLAQRELDADAHEIPRTTKIRVVHSLCDDKHIAKEVRDEILQSLGFEEMDPV